MNQSANQVLLIEDSNVQAKIIQKQILALSNFETIICNTMQEAREALESPNRFFVAVVDLNLPDAPDGEVVDLTLENGVPTVVLTATFNEELRQQFIRKRVADYFFKGSIRDMDPMVRSLERLYKNRYTTVMIVDDGLVDRSIMRQWLEIQQFKVIEAENGAKALEKLDENPEISLIITDFNMPEMDGCELVMAVRERHKMDQLPIIGVSAAGSGPLTARFLKNGANDFLTKPFEVEEFGWRVNQCMEMVDIFAELKNCYENMP